MNPCLNYSPNFHKKRKFHQECRASGKFEKIRIKNQTVGGRRGITSTIQNTIKEQRVKLTYCGVGFLKYNPRTLQLFHVKHLSQEKHDIYSSYKRIWSPQITLYVHDSNPDTWKEIKNGIINIPLYIYIKIWYKFWSNLKPHVVFTIRREKLNTTFFHQFFPHSRQVTIIRRTLQK